MFNEYQFNHLRRDLEYWAGLSASNEQLLEILKLCHKSLINEIMDPAYTRKPKFGYGLDTMDRDLFFDAVARYIGGTHWPINGESGSDYSRMFPGLLIKAVENGKLKDINN